MSYVAIQHTFTSAAEAASKQVELGRQLHKSNLVLVIFPESTVHIFRASSVLHQHSKTKTLPVLDDTGKRNAVKYPRNHPILRIGKRLTVV